MGVVARWRSLVHIYSLTALTLGYKTETPKQSFGAFCFLSTIHIKKVLRIIIPAKKIREDIGSSFTNLTSIANSRRRVTNRIIRRILSTFITLIRRILSTLIMLIRRILSAFIILISRIARSSSRGISSISCSTGMNTSRTKSSITRNISYNLLHCSILISNGFLRPSVNVSGLKLGLCRKDRTENLNQSSISRSINLAFSTSRGNAGSGSTGGNGSAVTSHSTKHRIQTGCFKVFNLSLMGSIAHVFLPRTAFSSFLSVELHSQGVLSLLPIALLRSQLSAFSGVF
nr:MAG TPA: hypothetical protein [Microviridae sp.]